MTIIEKEIADRIRWRLADLGMSARKFLVECLGYEYSTYHIPNVERGETYSLDRSIDGIAHALRLPNPHILTQPDRAAFEADCHAADAEHVQLLLARTLKQTARPTRLQRALWAVLPYFRPDPVARLLKGERNA
ncbi:MAG: hypothetical protein WC505_08025 [Patescibacteria group bacterium]